MFNQIDVMKHFSHLFILCLCVCVCAENIFKVTVHKTAQGLGLSVTGGVAPSIPVVDNCSWPGLIRIKKIFVHGAAWQTGKLAVGDVLLAVNGVPLTGSTNYVSSLSLSLSFPDFFLIWFQLLNQISNR